MNPCRIITWFRAGPYESVLIFFFCMEQENIGHDGEGMPLLWMNGI